MSPVFGAEASPLIGEISLLTGLLGLLVSVLGFGITLWQIKRSRTITQTVSAALQELSKKTELYDIVRELERAQTALESANRYSRIEHWDDVYRCCDEARASAHKVMVTRNIDKAEEHSELNELHKAISLLMTNISRAQSGKRAFPDPSKISENFISSIEVLRSAQRTFSLEIRQ